MDPPQARRLTGVDAPPRPPIKSPRPRPRAPAGPRDRTCTNGGHHARDSTYIQLQLSASPRKRKLRSTGRVHLSRGRHGLGPAQLAHPNANGVGAGGEHADLTHGSGRGRWGSGQVPPRPAPHRPQAPCTTKSVLNTRQSARKPRGNETSSDGFAAAARRVRAARPTQLGRRRRRRRGAAAAAARHTWRAAARGLASAQVRRGRREAPTA